MDNQRHNYPFNFTLAIQAWLTPIILVVLGTVLWSQWGKVQESIAKQADAQQQIMVKLATIQEQIREGQYLYSGVRATIKDMATEQRNHEHRLTVIESVKRDASTGRQFRPG